MFSKPRIGTKRRREIFVDEMRCPDIFILFYSANLPRSIHAFRFSASRQSFL